MASKTSRTKPTAALTDATVLDMAELGQRLMARRAEAAVPALPRNGGTRRTPSKQALLEAITKTGRDW